MRLDILRTQFDVVDAKCPEQKGISKLNTSDAYVELLLLEEIEEKILVIALDKVGLDVLNIKVVVVIPLRKLAAP